MKLMQWSAKRSGARITITGVDEHGITHRIGEVKEIAGGEAGVTAELKDGSTLDLFGGMGDEV